MIRKLANHKRKFTCLSSARCANRVGDDVFEVVPFRQKALTFDSLKHALLLLCTSFRGTWGHTKANIQFYF